MNTQRVQDILTFFEQRHIFLKVHWLQALLEYLDSVGNFDLASYPQLVYHQWFNTDLRQTTEGKYVRPVADVFSMQIVFQIINQSEEPGFPFRREFILTDGKSEIRAYEHEAIANFKDRSIGFKIFVKPDVSFQNGYLLLTPQNCRVLNGYMLGRIYKFFEQRHIFLKFEWLQAVLEYLDNSGNLDFDKYPRYIYHQWITSDISDTTQPKFVPPTANIFNRPTVFQVSEQRIISSSLHEQKKQHDDLKIHTPIVHNFIDDFKIPSKRMILLKLTDGKTEVRAIEHEIIPRLTNQPIGFKVFIFPVVRFQDETLLLTPKNCQVLDGCVSY